MTTPEILRRLPLVDEILESHRQRAHGDEAGYDAYKAHVYRTVNFARAFTPDAPDRDEKLAIAAAFHDLAAFETLDYLVPSIAAQDAWLQETGRENWSDELALIVAQHHRLSGYRSTRPHAPLVEAYRRADLVDVSQGLIRFGLPSSYVKEVRAAFDASVFFKRVVPSGTRGQSSSSSNPVSCVPAMHWSAPVMTESIAEGALIYFAFLITITSRLVSDGSWTPRSTPRKLSCMKGLQVDQCSRNFF